MQTEKPVRARAQVSSNLPARLSIQQPKHCPAVLLEIDEKGREKRKLSLPFIASYL